MAVLVTAEDDEDTRLLVTRSLRKAGHQVIAAANGLEGLAAALVHHPDAVITDIDMPRVDGVTMIRVMKRLNPDLRVLVSSGLASSDRLEARKAELETLGVDSILVKPYTTEKILPALHGLLAGWGGLQPALVWWPGGGKAG